MHVAVIVFPGSNCDHDAYHVFHHILDVPVDFVWHRETDLKKYDAIIIPGGFSYGDYLRTGAIARFSPVMESVIKEAHAGNDDSVIFFQICFSMPYKIYRHI
jgi:phosphoribosylformylglycinamidine synthase